MQEAEKLKNFIVNRKMREEEISCVILFTYSFDLMRNKTKGYSKNGKTWKAVKSFSTNEISVMKTKKAEGDIEERKSLKLSLSE